VRALPNEAKMQALDLYLTGISADAVATQTGISKGAVISVIKDAREGTLPPPTLKDRIDELHRLSVKLKKEGLDLPQARLGFSLLKTLQKMNIEPDSIRKWADFCSSLSPMPPADFVPAAVAMFQLEKETGKSYGELTSEVKGLASKKATLAVEVQDLQAKEATAKKLSVEIQARSQETSKLRTEKEALQRAVESLRAYLGKEAERLGISAEQLEARVKEMATVDSEINERSRRRNVLQGEIEALTERHDKLSAQMEKASTDFARDVESMSKLRAELTRTAVQKGKYEERVRNTAWSTGMISFLINPKSETDPDFDRIDMVVRCLDKWIAQQKLLAQGLKAGSLMWAQVKGVVDARRFALEHSHQ